MFLKSNEYSRYIIFYRTLDEDGDLIKIIFTKDDFRGYFIILNFGKVKSNQFKQGDIDELLNTGFYFNF